MTTDLRDFGLVRRGMCRCGVAIVVPSNASDAVLTAIIGRHNASRQHRTMYDAPADMGYDASHEAPPVSPPSGSHGDRRSDLTSRGASRVEPIRGDGLLISPDPRGGASIQVRPDGYDFRLVREPRR